MSIQSEIKRIKQDKEELRVALVNKGALLDEAAMLSEFTIAVNSLEIGGGSDLPGLPAMIRREENIITITAGIIDNTTIEIPLTTIPQPTVSLDVGDNMLLNIDQTSTEGYLREEEERYSVNISDFLPVIEENTITPSTENTILEAGQYLSGNQTILGDANLIPANIKKDVTIFGVTGEADGALPEVSFTTADLLVDKTAIDSEGNVVTGTMPYANIIEKEGIAAWGGENETYTVTIGKGYVSENVEYKASLSSKSENSDKIVIGVGWVNAPINISKTNLPDGLPEVSFTAADLLEDKTAIDSDGNVVTGTMPYSQQVTWEGGFHVNYTAGYLPEEIHEIAPSAEITETDEQVTISMGWVDQDIAIPKASDSSSSSSTTACNHTLVYYESANTLMDTVVFTDTSGFFTALGLSSELSSQPLTESGTNRKTSNPIALSSDTYGYPVYEGGMNKTVQLKYEKGLNDEMGWSIYVDGEFVCFTPGTTFVGTQTWYVSVDGENNFGEATAIAACETNGRAIKSRLAVFDSSNMVWGEMVGGDNSILLWDIEGRFESVELSEGDIILAIDNHAVGKVESPWKG